MPKCEECDRDFGSELGFQQHNRDKHNLNMVPSKKEIKQHEQENKLKKRENFLEEKNKSKQTKSLIKKALIVIPLILIASYYVFTPSGEATYVATDYISLNEEDPFLGDENAPVTIVEYSDFECPFCTRFYEQTEDSLIQQYVDTGKVKFVYKDFPVPSSHPKSQIAAEAAQCAHDQDKFWEFHDLLFENNYQGDTYTSMGNPQAIELFKE